jgi:hypothetical protein
MGALTRTFLTDKKKEEEGTWIEVAVNDDKTIARMRVKRMGPNNKAFTKRYAILARKFRSMRGDKEELERQALIAAFVDTCLVGWENIENIHKAKPGEKREPYMAFSKENANELFEVLPELLDFVVIRATEVENFQSEQAEVELKNLSPSSNTL